MNMNMMNMNMNVMFVLNNRGTIAVPCNSNEPIGNVIQRFLSKVGEEVGNSGPRFFFNAKQLRPENNQALHELDIDNGAKIEVVLMKELQGA